MPVIENKCINHHFIFNQDLSAPPPYAPPGQTASQSTNDNHHSEITFGMENLTISENFSPELRGLQRPHYFMGSRRNDIAEELDRTWKVVNIELTTVGHGAVNGAFDGLMMTTTLQIIRGLLYVASVGFSAIGLHVPFLKPVAAPLASFMLGASHSYGKYAVLGGQAAALCFGLHAGFSQHRALSIAKHQDMLIIRLIKLKNRLEAAQGPIMPALQTMERDIQIAATDISHEKHPAASVALTELCEWHQARVMQAGGGADLTVGVAA